MGFRLWVVHLSFEPVVPGKRISVGSISESDIESIGADYISEIKEEHRDEEIFRSLDSLLPKELFLVDRETRTVRIKPRDERDYSEVESWWNDIKVRVNALPACKAISSAEMIRHDICQRIKKFGDHSAILYIDSYGMCFASEAIDALLFSADRDDKYKPSVLYIGGILSVHY